MPRTAIVVGAGVGGLAAAGALARTGWRVTLLERGARLRADPDGLVLGANGLAALAALGVTGLDALTAAVPHGGVRRADGHLLGSGGGLTVRAVHRQDLYDALVAALGDVDVHTGVAVTDIPELARRPVVTNGHSAWTADLVVAADGVDSAVRTALAPAARPVAAGQVAWRAVVPAYRAPALDAHVEFLGRGLRFIATPLGGRGVAWTALAPGAARPEPPATQLDLLARWYATWPDPVAALVAATTPADLAQHPVTALPRPPRYGVPAGPGGFALLGDAAHAMSPHLGHGASLALEDAVTLAAALAAGDLHAGLAAYHRARWPRTAALSRRARRLAGLQSARGPLAVRARDALISALPPHLLDGGRTLTTWRPPT